MQEARQDVAHADGERTTGEDVLSCNTLEWIPAHAVATPGPHAEFTTAAAAVHSGIAHTAAHLVPWAPPARMQPCGR